MVRTYKAHCKACHAEFILKYGSKNKRKIIYETYSCPHCKNLFSLSINNQEFSCPTCGNTDLVRYNMNKRENLTYYKKMYIESLLPREKYHEINNFWRNVKSVECPKCMRHELSWSIYK